MTSTTLYRLAGEMFWKTCSVHLAESRKRPMGTRRPNQRVCPFIGVDYHENGNPIGCRGHQAGNLIHARMGSCICIQEAAYVGNC